MILLSGHSLTAGQYAGAEKMSLQLKERDSTAAWTPDRMDGISLDTWVQDDREPGAGIVWRVRSIQEVFNTRTPTVQLEHVICTLKDRVLFGEVTPATITGTTGATSCTARQAIEYILDQQGDWELGSFDYEDVSNPYKFDGETLFDALETVTNSLSDALWTYNLTAYPFKLNIVQRSSAVGSEMRAGRNMRTISRTIDKSGMYTRFYPIGKGDLHISGNYVERNTGSYGVISKVETDNSLETEAELTAWANQRLAIHAEPVVTIAVEGLDLSRETGEDLDGFQVGRVCRCPLPEFGTVIEERITELSYPDKIAQPTSVKVTMANTKNDVTRIIADALKRSGKRARASSRKDKQDLAWFEDTNDHVSMTAIGIIGVDAEGKPNWTRMSEFIADGEGLHAKVETEIGGVTDRVATLEINEEEIRSEVSASSSQIYTTISQTASGIFTEIANTASGLRAYIVETADQYSRTYVSTDANKIWVQDSDPRTGGSSPKEGDIWVESTSHGTWDGASGFDWEHDEDYDWSQVQGAKIWTWKNDTWELVSDQQEVVTMTDVEQTSEHIVQRAIRAFTNDEGNLSVYRAELEVKADQIMSEVRETISGIGSRITQTAEEINSSVWAAKSALYSEIVQTASSINQKVAYKPIVIVQWTEPTDTAEHTLVEGDIWIKSTLKRTWNDVLNTDWDELDENNFPWSALKGATIYVYTNGEWQIAMDETVLASDVDVEEGNDHWQATARDIETLNGRAIANEAQLKVTAKEIRSYVNNITSGLGSSIRQTATEIRAEVHAAQSTLYSEIKMTASNIALSVRNSVSDLRSRIELTADSITTSVAAAKSTLYSEIKSTASSISISVRNTVSDLRASIQVTQNSITTSVAAAKSTMYSQITQTASTIRSEVASAISGVNSTITQTASQIRSEVASTKSGLKSEIKQNADNISLKVSKDGVISSINQTAETITINASKINLSGYVKATDLTTNWLSAKIADISSVVGKTFSLDNCYAGTFKFRTSSGSGYAYTDFKDLFVTSLALTQSGNTYTLTSYNANATPTVIGTFSRATSLSATWDGNRKFTVSASPQGNSRYTTIRSSVPDSKRSISGGTLTATIQATIDDSETFQDIGTVTISIPSYSSRTLRCTEIEPTYPGSSSKYYYFRLEGNYSFNTGTNYTMYRTSW